MGKDIIKDNPITGIDECIAGVHKHFGGRMEKIKGRLNVIEEKLSEVQQDSRNKAKDFSKAKSAAKKAMGAATNTAINVELLASQEEAIGDIDLDGLGLLDSLKKGALANNEITADESRNIVELAAKVKNEFTRKLDNLEKRIDVLYKGFDIGMDKLGHETPKAEQVKAEPVSDLSKAYELLNEMYEDLNKRFDILEKKLDRIEKEIEKRIPDVRLEKRPKANDLMEGVCGKEHMAFERDPKEIHKFEGEEPKPLKGIKNLKFGKFDANVLFPAINGRTDDEFKDYVYSTYKDVAKADREYKIQRRRIEKLEEKGYVEKDDGRYKIADKGIAAAEEVNKAFEFTSYDANVVFGYINKNDGQLSLENLKASLEKDYKTKEEVDKQFKYLQKRIENNLKEGYLEKNNEGNYVIADKGKKAAALKLKKNKENSIAL